MPCRHHNVVKTAIDAWYVDAKTKQIARHVIDMSRIYACYQYIHFRISMHHCNCPRQKGDIPILFGSNPVLLIGSNVGPSAIVQVKQILPKNPSNCHTVGSCFRFVIFQHNSANKYIFAMAHMCTVCEATFACKRNLTRHTAVHENVRYHCCTCETPFTYEGNMQRHMKKQHAGYCVTAKTALIDPFRNVTTLATA